MLFTRDEHGLRCMYVTELFLESPERLGRRHARAVFARKQVRDGQHCPQASLPRIERSYLIMDSYTPRHRGYVRLRPGNAKMPASSQLQLHPSDSLHRKLPVRRQRKHSQPCVPDKSNLRARSGMSRGRLQHLHKVPELLRTQPQLDNLGQLQ